MSSSLLVSEESKEDGQGKVSTEASSSSGCISHKSRFKKCNYLGLADCSSVDSSTVPTIIEEKNNILNMKATELRLGLPGSQSPDREPNLYLSNTGKLDERPLFPFLPIQDAICMLSQKNIVSGNKRGFSDTLDRFSEVKSSPCNEGKWKLQTETELDTPKILEQGKLPNKSPINMMLSPRPPCTQPPVKKEVPDNVLQDQARIVKGTTHNHTGARNNSGSAPVAKEQVVGWPPIRSFRKNSLATPSKNNDEVDGKLSAAALFVKVSMDGAPYLRKVDLRTYSTYQGLSSALEKMFDWLTLDQGGSQGGQGKEMLNEGKLTDLINGSEYVLTYEDKDGDWMLVGDVPWEMFIESCKRLKIMKGADAIGLGRWRSGRAGQMVFEIDEHFLNAS